MRALGFDVKKTDVLKVLRDYDREGTGKITFEDFNEVSKYMLYMYMSHRVGKPTICICENKDADQLRGNREADQRLCFRYMDSAIPLLSKSKISSF